MRTLVRAVLAVLIVASSSGLTGYAPEEWNEPIGDIVVHHASIDGINYVEVVPKDYDGRSPLPMVVYFHGRGDRPRMPDGPLLGNDQPIRLILPRAPKPLGDGFTWLPVSAHDGESRELVRGLKHMSGWMANVIEGLVDRYATLGSPIVAGFSQGGMLTFALAVHHPEVVGAAYPVAGWLPPSMLPNARERTRSHPIIRAMHGTEDPILDVSRTRTIVQALEESGLTVELHEYDAPHEMTPEMWEDLRSWLQQEVRDRVRTGERARGSVV